MQDHAQLCEEVLIALRRVIRAIDIHSRTLLESHGLTGPQALILKALQDGFMSAGQLANQINLSQGTVTDILKRLENKKLISRLRDQSDRRRVLVDLTLDGRSLLKKSPPLLQEQFSRRFMELQDWEQTQLLSSLQRIASMMDATEIDASPFLSSGIEIDQNTQTTSPQS